MHWSSKVPKKIKRNIITNDLHRGKKISSDFAAEVKEIAQKYEAAGYPKRYVDSIIKDFKEKKEKEIVKKEEKVFFPIKIPYCVKNEMIAKHFLQKLKVFTYNKFAFTIVWQTRKIKTLFKLKDPIKHKANVIYKGVVDNKPNIDYIGETKLIADSRWNTKIQNMTLLHQNTYATTRKISFHG